MITIIINNFAFPQRVETMHVIENEIGYIILVFLFCSLFAALLHEDKQIVYQSACCFFCFPSCWEGTVQHLLSILAVDR